MSTVQRKSLESKDQEMGEYGTHFGPCPSPQREQEITAAMLAGAELSHWSNTKKVRKRQRATDKDTKEEEDCASLPNRHGDTGCTWSQPTVVCTAGGGSSAAGSSDMYSVYVQ